jgi:hypothetical protein
MLELVHQEISRLSARLIRAMHPAPNDLGNREENR